MEQNVGKALQPEAATVTQPITFCRITGELDFCNLSRIEPALTRWTERQGQLSVIDLSGLEFMDAAALHMLQRLDIISKTKGTRLLFLVSPFHHRVMRIVGLDRALSIYKVTGGEPISRGRIRWMDVDTGYGPSLAPSLRESSTVLGP
jgi:anti-anti-sigma factor